MVPASPLLGRSPMLPPLISHLSWTPLMRSGMGRRGAASAQQEHPCMAGARAPKNRQGWSTSSDPLATDGNYSSQSLHKPPISANSVTNTETSRNTFKGGLLCAPPVCTCVNIAGIMPATKVYTRCNVRREASVTDDRGSCVGCS